MTLTTHATGNNKQGSSGRYTPLRKRRAKGKKTTAPLGYGEDFNYLDNNTDLTMRFTNAKDPIYFAFDYLEKRSVPQLMSDFVKDSFFEIANFVSKVAK